MTASADGPSPLTSLPITTVDSLFGPPLESVMTTRSFKRHKVLPHPKRASISSLASTASTIRYPSNYDLVLDTSLPDGAAVAGMTDSPPTSLRGLKHRSRRIGSGPPDLPPTPPAHSRTSSSSHSASSSTRPRIETPQSSAEDVKMKQPTTPIAQMSPPTPDVTPPRVATHRRLKAIRPSLTDRMPSKATTDSRTESFKTARENPSDDEVDELEEDGDSTLRPAAPSARTSQTTVRHVPGDARRKSIGLGVGMESSPENSVTSSRSKGEFVSFDGEWGSPIEVEQEWDDNLNRNVVVRKRRQPSAPNGDTKMVVEKNMITPTNATKALRSVTLPGRILAYPSSHVTIERSRPHISEQRSVSNSSGNTDTRRFSGMSTKSTVDTVVEAILVDTMPRRHKTLRHVRKQFTLRDSSSDISPPSTAPTSIQLEEGSRRSRPKVRVSQEGRHQSTASTATYNSISSSKARREIWRNGGIPVVIVPDRRSSTRASSKEPSLRSTSSRRSKRSNGLNSAPLSQISKTKDLTPYFERPSRRSRALSESDGSAPGDQRTIDYPPIVPRRTSSLSAPTSRNVSRSGSRRSSLTTDSLKAHNAIHVEQALMQPKERTQDQPSPRDQLERTFPDVRLESATSIVSQESTEEAEKRNGLADLDDPRYRLAIDKHGDLMLGRRTSLQNTPFSMASMETSTSHQSHAEVSEALAVNIYPHQNTSVLMVDHSHKPSDGSDGSQKHRSVSSEDTIEPPKRPTVERPTIKTTDYDAAVPVTPPQASSMTMEDVDSPLRNPRAPPMPPAINFIPATPSGLTPSQDKEKQLGNYFGEVAPKPKRSVSLVRRALSLRRNTSTTEYGPSASRSPGLITRTLSLTRSLRKDPGERFPRDKGKAPASPAYWRPEDGPQEEGKLHPLWRPASYYAGDDDDLVYDQDEDYETYSYPAIDNRPALPRRTLSDRMKRTFAILPVKDLEEYPATSDHGPERRTVRRTASGNLRVVKRRASLDSVPRQNPNDGRPYTAPEQRSRRHFWRAATMPNVGHSDHPSSSHGDGGKWARMFPTLVGSKFIGEYGGGGLQTLKRRLSLSERRREKRSAELRQKISGPREVRDGVGDVIRRNSYRDAFTQAQCDPQPL